MNAAKTTVITVLPNVEKERSYYVVKKNNLIDKSRYSLSLTQHKLLLYLISKIKPTDSPDTVYELDIKNFCEVCGMRTDTGTYYQNIKRDLKIIADTSAYVIDDDGFEVLFRWFDLVKLKRSSGKVYISFHKTVSPYLFGLNAYYTQYPYIFILPMKCKYSIRLYELIVKNKHLDSFIVSINDIKILTGSQNYEKHSHFMERVFLPAVEEINAFTDYSISYELIKSGRSFTDIVIAARKKDSDEECFKLNQAINYALQPK